MKKKILIVDNSIAVTGALNAILNAIIPLQDEFEFIFVLPENSAAVPALQQYQVQTLTLPFVEINKQVRNLLLYFPALLVNGYRLKKIATDHRIAVVHMNDFYNLTGITAKMLGGRFRLLTHVRFMPQRFHASLAKTWAGLNLKFADGIICVSGAVKSFFPPDSKVHLIYDPLPGNEKLPPKSVSSQNPEIKLLYLSNFIPGKGQNFALAAFREAYRVNSSLRLVFAGGDMGLEKNRHYRQALEEEVRLAGLQGVITFKSFIQDVEKEIKAADVVLNFSESESFSLTCLDALVYGTPLIASDCGGPAELFENNQSGILVPNKEVAVMTRAMLDLSADAAKRRRFAEAGKDYVKEKFQPLHTYLKLKNLYRAVTR